MLKLFGGILIVITGFVTVTISYYYAWVSGTPGISSNAYEQYQLYSMVIGILSLGIIVLGIFMFISSIRKLNRKYLESNERND